jgi:signal peptidase I
VIAGLVIAGVLLVLPVAAAWVVRRRFSVVRVVGESMAPAYRRGEVLLVRHGAGGWRVGQVVVFRPPAGTGGGGRVESVVKRVAAVAGEPVPVEFRGAVRDGVVPGGRLLVRGDHPESTDSRHWGYVPASDVLGTVRRRLGGG